MAMFGNGAFGPSHGPLCGPWFSTSLGRALEAIFAVAGEPLGALFSAVPVAKPAVNRLYLALGPSLG